MIVITRHRVGTALTHNLTKFGLIQYTTHVLYVLLHQINTDSVRLICIYYPHVPIQCSWSLAYSCVMSSYLILKLCTKYSHHYYNMYVLSDNEPIVTECLFAVTALLWITTWIKPPIPLLRHIIHTHTHIHSLTICRFLTLSVHVWGLVSVCVCVSSRFLPLTTKVMLSITYLGSERLFYDALSQRRLLE